MGRIVIELIRTVGTILGITVGWVMIGVDGLHWTNGTNLLGCALIVLSAVVGLGWQTENGLQSVAK